MDALGETPSPRGLPLPGSMPVPSGLSVPGSGLPPASSLSVPASLHHQHGQQAGMAMPQQPTQQTQTHAYAQAQSMTPDSFNSVKLTRGHSCVLCQQRKVRCDKNKPCANCVKAQVECRVVPPQPPRRRKKKPQERELVDRLRKYEALLSQHGVNFDPIAHDFKHVDQVSSTIDEVDELQHDLVGLKTSPSSSNQEHSSEQGGPTSKWSPYRDYRSNDDTLRDSSDDEVEGSTIHHAFDSMFDNQDGFPFVIGGSTSTVTDYHPSGIQIFQMWQIYLTNVNPLLKVTHTQTLQAQIIEAGANVAKIPRPLEALMFSIYFIAVTSMSEEDVQSTFDEEKSRLLSRFHRASQQALINAGFMRSPDIMVLQAYFLYLICVRQYVDPRSLFCLIGIAVRVAQRLGLHRDGAQFNLPPFEVELRRRLWWQIVVFDKRIAEITGSAITALSSSNSDTKFPLNINDTDLHLHAKDAPTPYNGPTEMLFCLTRVEMCTAGGSSDGQPSSSSSVSPSNNNNSNSAASNTSTSGSSSNPGPSGPSNVPAGKTSASGPPPGSAAANVAAATRKFHYSPSPSSPDVVTHVANQTLPSDTESYCSYIESTYLKSCDPKIPLQFFTLMMTRQALSKMRVINFLARNATSAAAAAAAAAAASASPASSSPSNNNAAPMGFGMVGGGMGGMGGMMGGGMMRGGMMGGGMMGMGGGMMSGMMGGMMGGGGPGLMGMAPPGFGPGMGQSGGPVSATAPPHLPPPIDDTERETLFLEAIHMIEYDNVMQSAESLRGFTWYTYMHFPFPAYMFLVIELRNRRTGDLVERAWHAICENHEQRGLIRNLRSPIHVAFGALFIKAWDAHEAAELQNGRALKAPKFIELMRRLVPKLGNPAGAAAAAATGATGATGAATGSASRGGTNAPQRPLPTASSGGSNVGGGGGNGDEQQQQHQQQQQQQQQHQHQQQHLVRQVEEEIVMGESATAPHQHQQHQQIAAQGLHPSASSSTTSSPPAAQQQQHQPMVYATQQQQPAAGVFDGLMGPQMMGMNLPEMMDFGPTDWSFLIQGEYGNGLGNGGGGAGGQGGGFGGGFGSMYGHGG